MQNGSHLARPRRSLRIRALVLVTTLGTFALACRSTEPVDYEKQVVRAPDGLQLIADGKTVPVESPFVFQPDYDASVTVTYVEHGETISLDPGLQPVRFHADGSFFVGEACMSEDATSCSFRGVLLAQQLESPTDWEMVVRQTLAVPFYLVYAAYTIVGNMPGFTYQ